MHVLTLGPMEQLAALIGDAAGSAQQPASIKSNEEAVGIKRTAISLPRSPQPT